MSTEFDITREGKKGIRYLDSANQGSNLLLGNDHLVRARMLTKATAKLRFFNIVVYCYTTIPK